MAYDNACHYGYSPSPFLSLGLVSNGNEAVKHATHRE